MATRVSIIAGAVMLLLAGCMRGGAARAAQLPQPTSIAQWLAIAVIVIGLWWLALKILRG